MTERERRKLIRETLAEFRGREMRAAIEETRFLRLMAETLGPGDKLAREIWQLGREADGLGDEDEDVVTCWLERRAAVLKAAAHRVC
jgi:hypothetical protein